MVFVSGIHWSCAQLIHHSHYWSYSETHTQIHYESDPKLSGNPFGSELPTIDSNYLSVLGAHVELSHNWKETYQEWLEVEVFQYPKDWDSILHSPPCCSPH